MSDRCLYCGRLLTSGDSGHICFNCWYKEDYSKRNNIIEQKTYTLTINNEPLSTKQLHELITSQQMTIDRLLTRQGEMLDAMKEMRAWLNDPAYVIAPTVANNLKAIIARVMG